MTVPNGYGEFEMDSWLFRLLRLQKVVDALAHRREAVAATDNLESGHIQFFTRSRLKRIFAEAGLSIFREAAASLLAGPVAGHFVAMSPRFILWNAGVTDRLPIVLLAAREARGSATSRARTTRPEPRPLTAGSQDAAALWMT